MPTTCPVCGEPAFGPVEHGTAKALRTPEFHTHVYHGRVYWHWNRWPDSAPEGVV